MTATIQNYTVGQRDLTDADLEAMPVGIVLMHNNGHSTRTKRADGRWVSNEAKDTARGPGLDGMGRSIAYRVHSVPDTRPFEVGCNIENQEQLDALPVGAEIRIDALRRVKTEHGWHNPRTGNHSAGYGHDGMSGIYVLHSLPEPVAVDGLDLDELPVGSTVWRNEHKVLTWTKQADGSWELGGNTVNAADLHREGLTLRKRAIDLANPRVGDKIETLEQIAALPVGAQITYRDRTVYTKREDQRWGYDAHTCRADHFSMNGTNVITFLPEPVVVPEVAEVAEPVVIAEVEVPVDTTVSEDTIRMPIRDNDHLRSLPIGTTIDQDDPGYWWEKCEGEVWALIRDGQVSERNMTTGGFHVPPLRLRSLPEKVESAEPIVLDIHAGLGAQVMAIEAECIALRAQVAEFEAWKARLVADAHRHATRHDMCSDFDDFMEAHDMPRRESDDDNEPF